MADSNTYLCAHLLHTPAFIQNFVELWNSKHFYSLPTVYVEQRVSPLVCQLRPSLWKLSNDDDSHTSDHCSLSRKTNSFIQLKFCVKLQRKILRRKVNDGKSSNGSDWVTNEHRNVARQGSQWRFSMKVLDEHSQWAFLIKFSWKFAMTISELIKHPQALLIVCGVESTLWTLQCRVLAVCVLVLRFTHRKTCKTRNARITYLSLLFLFSFQLFAFAHFADLMWSGALARTAVLTIILSEAAGTFAAAFSFLLGCRLTASLRCRHRGLAGHTLIIIHIHRWAIFLIGRPEFGAHTSVGHTIGHTIRLGTQRFCQQTVCDGLAGSLPACYPTDQKIWSNELQIERSKNQKIGEIEEHTIKNHIKTIFSAATISCFP